MTRKSKKQSTTRNEATSVPQLMKPDDASASDGVLIGRPPTSPPPRVADFEELDKKALDVLVDSLKYVATTSGIVIAMYSQSLRENLKVPIIESRPPAQALLFAPLLLWFAAIIGTVIGIFPREHHATTDVE